MALGDPLAQRDVADRRAVAGRAAGIVGERALGGVPESIDIDDVQRGCTAGEGDRRGHTQKTTRPRRTGGRRTRRGCHLRSLGASPRAHAGRRRERLPRSAARRPWLRTVPPTRRRRPVGLPASGAAVSGSRSCASTRPYASSSSRIDDSSLAWGSVSAASDPGGADGGRSGAAAVRVAAVAGRVLRRFGLWRWFSGAGGGSVREAAAVARAAAVVGAVVVGAAARAGEPVARIAVGRELGLDLTQPGVDLVEARLEVGRHAVALLRHWLASVSLVAAASRGRRPVVCRGLSVAKADARARRDQMNSGA